MRIAQCISRLSLHALVAFGLAIASASSHGAEFPNRPIRIVVGFGAGGATDLTARELARRMEVKLGQPVIVDNKPGAGAIIAMQAVASAAPDGYTLILGTPAGFTISPYLFKKISYNPKEFVPVSAVSAMANTVIASTSFPANTLSDLIKQAKTRQAPLAYGSYGVGTTGHLAMELFKSRVGLDATHIAYKGDTPAYVAIRAKEIDVAVVTMFAAQARIASGEVKGLGVLQADPDPSLPSMQTAAQAGAAGVDLPTWLALFAPPKTPKEVATVLESTVQSILASNDFKAYLIKNGSAPLLLSNRDLVALMDKQSAQLREKIRELNLVGEQ